MKSKRAFESLQELFWFTSPEKGKEENIEELVKSRPIYQMKNTSKRGMFVQLTHNKIKYYTLSYYFDWVWKTNENYWTTVFIPTAPILSLTPYLQYVYYIDTNFWIDHIKSGKYKFYLMHYLEDTFATDRLTLSILVGDKVVYKDEHFPNKEFLEKNEEMYRQRKEKYKDPNDDENFIRVNKQYVTDIDIPESMIPDPKKGITVKIQFMKNDDYSKEGWYIHGGLLTRQFDYKDFIKPNRKLKKKKEYLLY